jgi:hypothetical protein
MEHETKNSRTISNHLSSTEVYPPSWIDKLTDWVARRPGSSWLYYFGLYVVLLLFQSIVFWMEGAGPIGTFHPVHVFLAGIIPFILAMFHYLDEWAGSALAKLRQDLTVNEEKYQELHFQITTLPMGRTIIASLVFLGLSFLTELITGDPYLPQTLAAFPNSANISRIIYLVCWLFMGAYLYHTIHQLRSINLIYTRHTDVNLFRMRPLYAFSNLSAFTAGSLAVIIYGWVLVNPSFQLSDPVLLVWIIIFIIAALVTFVWPQMGMHRIQVAEQERLLDEVYIRLESIIAKLHGQLDKGELQDMEELNFAIGSLETEINTIKRIRTWPWEPETLQILVTALALPLGLWFIQLIVERLFGS